MKKALALLGSTALLSASAGMACATSDDEARPSTDDGGTTVLTDAGGDANPTPDATPPVVPTCSSAGWCRTTLPDGDLDLRDIWAFASRAFAIAESPTLGVKVLEWDEAPRAWSYIDDDTQNGFELDAYAGKIWAPNENEVYFASGPGLVYHGNRATPGAAWSWKRTQLEDTSPNRAPDREPGRIDYYDQYWNSRDATALGVWGTSADDVYAWYGGTIFHLESAGGGADKVPVPVHVLEDAETPADSFFVFGASGSGPDDVWFAAGRARFDWNVFRCPMVLHKTASGFARLVDNVIDEADVGSHYYDTCREKKDVLGFRWHSGKDMFHWTNGGWMTNIESAGPGRAAGIVGERLFAYVESGTPGTARVNVVAAQVPRDSPPTLVNAVWINGADTWISGWGLVLRAPTDPTRWSSGLGLYTQDDAKQLLIDAPTYAFSPTSINGAPLDRPLHQVRGTSNENLWAIGLQHALHKTTP